MKLQLCRYKYLVFAWDRRQQKYEARWQHGQICLLSVLLLSAMPWMDSLKSHLSWCALERMQPLDCFLAAFRSIPMRLGCLCEGWEASGLHTRFFTQEEVSAGVP